MKRTVVGWACLVAITAWWTRGNAAVTPQTTVRPNILLIQADDLGYGDLSAYRQARDAVARSARARGDQVHAVLPGSTGEPNKQGFEYAFGFLDHRHAHRQFTDHLWRNGERLAVDVNRD